MVRRLWDPPWLHEKDPGRLVLLPLPHRFFFFHDVVTCAAEHYRSGYAACQEDAAEPVLAHVILGFSPWHSSVFEIFSVLQFFYCDNEAASRLSRPGPATYISDQETWSAADLFFGRIQLQCGPCVRAYGKGGCFSS